MLLSIITINYNDAAGLRRTVESVLGQTSREFEHVIVDGASGDGSAELVAEYAAHAPCAVKWVSERDEGIYAAMNKGIRMADGEYIQILNAGDCLASATVVQRMYEALERNGRPDILYGNMLKTKDWKRFVRDDCGANSEYAPSSFLYFYNGTLNHDCAYIKRALFDAFGYYNEAMNICADWEWYMRAIVFGKTPAVYVDIDVTRFDMNGISESGGKSKDLIRMERRAYLEKTLPPAILADYDNYAFPITQYRRLKKHRLWGLVHFVERVLFKLEKWNLLR